MRTESLVQAAAFYEEHAVLVRMWARLQSDAGDQLQHLTQARQRLQVEVVQLRGAVVVQRTAMLWGLWPAGIQQQLIRKRKQ